MGIQKVYVV